MGSGCLLQEVARMLNSRSLTQSNILPFVHWARDRWLRCPSVASFASGVIRILADRTPCVQVGTRSATLELFGDGLVIPLETEEMRLALASDQAANRGQVSPRRPQFVYGQFERLEFFKAVEKNRLLHRILVGVELALGPVHRQRVAEGMFARPFLSVCSRVHETTTWAPICRLSAEQRTQVVGTIRKTARGLRKYRSAVGLWHRASLLKPTQRQA